MNHKRDSKLVGWCIFTLLVGCGDRESGRIAPPGSPEPLAVENTAELAGGQPNLARGPRQKHPEILVLPDQPNPIGDRLRREFSGLLPNEAAYVDKLRRLWQENLAMLPGRNLESAADADVASGTKLPTEFTVFEPTDRWKDTPEAMVGGLALLSVGCEENLALDFAVAHAETLPPTYADLIIFEALNDAILEHGPGRKVSQFEQWKPLAEARNPLYRLLALRAALRAPAQEALHLSPEDPRYTRIDGSAKLGFYLKFLNERDSRLLTEAISAIATVPGPEAHEAIRKFQATQKKLGDGNLVQAATTALRTQELTTRSSQ